MRRKWQQTIWPGGRRVVSKVVMQLLRARKVLFSHLDWGERDTPVINAAVRIYHARVRDVSGESAWIEVSSAQHAALTAAAGPLSHGAAAAAAGDLWLHSLHSQKWAAWVQQADLNKNSL